MAIRSFVYLALAVALASAALVAGAAVDLPLAMILATTLAHTLPKPDPAAWTQHTNTR